MLNSSRSRGRSSNDHHRLTKQRSQHSLIIESVARILDDSALEDRVTKKHALHEPTFRTGPPSEVHQNFIGNNLYGQHHMGAENFDFDFKWQRYFDAQSSSSIHTPSTNKGRPTGLHHTTSTGGSHAYRTLNRINSMQLGTPPAQF